MSPAATWFSVVTISSMKHFPTADVNGSCQAHLGSTYTFTIHKVIHHRRLLLLDHLTFFFSNGNLEKVILCCHIAQDLLGPILKKKRRKKEKKNKEKSISSSHGLTESSLKCVSFSKHRDLHESGRERL